MLTPTARHLSLAALLGALGCAQQNPGTPPPTDRFYYPTGVAWVGDLPDGGGAGTVYVGSSDFDLRFNRGTVAAVDVASLNLPAVPGTIPQAISDPHIAKQLTVDPFGGPLALFAAPGATGRARRLFVAGRQNNLLQAIDVDGTNIACVGTDGTDCTASAVKLNSGDPATSLKDTFRPVVAGGDVWVGHLTPVDDPPGSGSNRISALARVSATALGTPTIFHIGVEPVDGMAQVGGLLYLGGRSSGSDANNLPMRRLRLADPEGSLQAVDVRAGAFVVDTRGMALSSDGTRLYLVGRVPDTLIIMDMSPGVVGSPKEEVIGLVQLPRGASEVVVIPRGNGRRDLVAVSCSDDGSVALYDDEVGRLVSTVRGVGEQPFGLAVAARPDSAGKRLFVTAFGRGDLAVVDLPDLDNPATAAVLAVIGPNQNCLNDNVDARPPECPK